MCNAEHVSQMPLIYYCKKVGWEFSDTGRPSIHVTMFVFKILLEIKLHMYSVSAHGLQQGTSLRVINHDIFSTKLPDVLVFKRFTQRKTQNLCIFNCIKTYLTID